MRWSWIIGLLVLGCGNEAPAVPPAPGGDGGGPLGISGLVPPPSNPGPSGGASGAGGAGGASGAGGSSGACDNDGDLESLSFVSSGRQVARDCSVDRCSGFVDDSFRYQGCVSECVAGDIPGISVECASCYAAAERCGLDNLCYQRCRIAPCNSTCVSCLTIAGCLDALAECTGIPVDDCER